MHLVLSFIFIILSLSTNINNIYNLCHCNYLYQLHSARHNESARMIINYMIFFDF